MERYYDILEVSPDADAAAIKKQFKKISLKAHPDKGGSNEKMAEVNRAWQVLGDEKRRERYNRLGVDWEMEDEEDKKIMEDIRQSMEPLGRYIIQFVIGAVYVIFIQNFWLNILVSIGVLALLHYAEIEAGNGRLIGFAIVVLGWISRWSRWIHFFIEAFVLWNTLFLIGDIGMVKIVGAFVSLFLGWWFDGRIFYYFMLLVLGAVGYVLIWMVLVISMAARKEHVEAQLEKLTTEIKPYVRKLKRDKKDLNLKVSILEEKIRMLQTLVKSKP